MDDKNFNDYLLRPEPAQPRRRRLWIAIVAPLAVCVLLLLAASLVQPDDQTASIPNTGKAVLLPAPTQSAPSSASPTLAPGSTYPGTAKGLLLTCLSSFQDFISVEEAGAHAPAEATSPDWRDQVSQAAQAFRSDCQTLGNLPPAPRAYTELEHWLKLTAAEVAPVTDNFNAAVDHQQLGAYRVAMDHLDKFVQYANNAERILFGLDQKRFL